MTFFLIKSTHDLVLVEFFPCRLPGVQTRQNPAVSAVGQPASHLLRPLLKRVLFLVCRIARLLSLCYVFFLALSDADDGDLSITVTSS